MDAGATYIIIDIPITIDQVTEQAEIFGTTFNVSSSLSGVVLSRNASMATCIIIDNTSKIFMVNICKNYIILLDITVSFGHSTYTAHEGDKLVQIGLNFSNPLSFNCSIKVLTMNGSATG